MDRRVFIISIHLLTICLLYSCHQSPSDNGNAQPGNDSITLVDTIMLMQPTPPFHYRDSVIRKKYSKKDLSKEYVIRSRTVDDSANKFWYLNQAIELDSNNGEAYYERGTLKTMLASSVPPLLGCDDFYKAKKLGYVCLPNGCNCKE
jgi:hypothetical protein